MTKSLAGRKEKQRRVGDAEKISEKRASNRVGRNDPGVWPGGSGSAGVGRRTKRQEVAQKRVAFWSKKYRYTQYSVC